MASPVAEPKSVSMIIKQRQQSRSSTLAPKPSSGRPASQGAGTANVNDNLDAVPPPLYPPASKTTPLCPESNKIVATYDRLSEYFKSNYYINPDSKKEDHAFYLPRYTDQYKSPLATKPHLVYKLHDSKFPDELTKKVITKRPAKATKHKLEDLPDTEDKEKDAQAAIKVKTEPPDEEEEEENEEPNTEDFDEIEEDLDEEMDQGTDYAQSYFDNGEGDDDDRDDEDGPTY